MPHLAPIYSIDTCQFSAPLQWGLTIFWREPEPDNNWLSALGESLEPDGLRLLSHRFIDECTSQFLVSSVLAVSPATIVQRCKGRLYYLIRQRKTKPFRGNFAIRSIGNASRESVEEYVADQLGHHRMADPNVQARLEQYQIHFPNIDLSNPQKTSHGLFWYNLHLVFVHRERWCEIRHEVLLAIREMILRVSKKYSFRLARAGILPDHVHLLGVPFDFSPGEVALCYLNNLAFAHGMKPVYQFGGFVGTVGEYTNKAI